MAGIEKDDTTERKNNNQRRTRWRRRRKIREYVMRGKGETGLAFPGTAQHCLIIAAKGSEGTTNRYLFLMKVCGRSERKTDNGNRWRDVGKNRKTEKKQENNSNG